MYPSIKKAPHDRAREGQSCPDAVCNSRILTLPRQVWLKLLVFDPNQRFCFQGFIEGFLGLFLIMQLVGLIHSGSAMRLSPLSRKLWQQESTA
jgi:hypothetical protein